MLQKIWLKREIAGIVTLCMFMPMMPHGCSTMGAHKKHEEKSQALGNKICPVSGQKSDERTKVTYSYKGKIYNLCCKACIKDFKKDPDKYIKKVEEELKKRAEQEKKAMPAPEMPEGMSEGHHHTESHQEHQH